MSACFHGHEVLLTATAVAGDGLIASFGFGNVHSHIALTPRGLSAFLVKRLSLTSGLAIHEVDCSDLLAFAVSFETAIASFGFGNVLSHIALTCLLSAFLAKCLSQAAGLAMCFRTLPLPRTGFEPMTCCLGGSASLFPPNPCQ